MRHADLPIRARNTIIAGALGDAWGGPFAGSIGLQRALFPAHPRLSDDTWLTLATCEAIASDGGSVRPERVAGVFREWYDQKRFGGLGSATLKALGDLSAGTHWTSSGARGELLAAAGVAMRAAPLAFFLDPEDEDDRQRLRDISRITHHSEEGYAGAFAVVLAIRRCLQRWEVPADLLIVVAEQVPDTRLRERLREMHGFGGDVAGAAARFGASGDVVEAVPLALFIAARGGDTLDAALGIAASVGGAADTIAGIVGQLRGASGCEVPVALLESLPERSDIEAVLQPFVQLVGSAVA